MRFRTTAGRMRNGLLSVAMCLTTGAQAAQSPAPLPPPRPPSPYSCEMVGAERLSGSRVDVVYRVMPEPITVGKHFSIVMLVCPHAGVTAPASVVLDATMPEHRHGMNYKPRVTFEYGGRQGYRYRAEGMMFHMGGIWELKIEVRAGGGTDRLTRRIAVD